MALLSAVLRVGQGVAGLAWCGNELLATWSDRVPQSVALWNPRSGQREGTLPHLQAVTCAAWTPSGALLASGDDRGGVRLWDVSGRECVATLKGHTGHVTSVAWSVDGLTLASSSRDGTVRVWSVFGDCLRTLRIQDVERVRWSPDGRLATVDADSTVVCAWAMRGDGAECGLVLDGHAHHVVDVAWSPDGRRLASASLDRTARIWHTGTGTCAPVLKGHKAHLTCVAWAEAAIATGSADKTLRLWAPDDVKRPLKAAVKSPFGAPVTGCAWSPDGRALAASHRDSPVCVWTVT